MVIMFQIRLSLRIVRLQRYGKPKLKLFTQLK